MSGSIPSSVIWRVRVLDLLALLFLCRVLGQLGVYLGIFPFLPPLGQWQSGALRYPVLLFWQTIILLVMLLIRTRLVTKGRLVGHVTARYLRTPVRAFAIFYAAVMLVRLLVWSWGELHDFHFFGVWIPPVFHLVLASYLFMVSTVLSPNDPQSTAAS